MLDYFRNLFGCKKGSSEAGTTAIAVANQTPRGARTASEPQPSALSQLNQTPRIFLSYSRADAAFAAEVRRMVEGRGLSLWQDISHMEAGRWWDQIKEILSAPTTEHMVLVVSSDALASKVVRDEWRFARREGVQVSSVRVPGRLGMADFAKMPDWMKAEHFFDLRQNEHADRMIAGLKGPSKQVRVPHMAPNPDAHFVLRQEEGAQLMALMLQGGNAAVGITAALRGAGGYGKTQLARWLAHQEAIEDAFYDGILWVELGERPNVHIKVEGLTKALTGEAPGLPDVTMAAGRLKEVIADRHMLLVIDDAWNKSDIEPFLGGASNLVRLITTRFDHVLPHDAARVPVDGMKPAEATELLAVGLPSCEIDPQRSALEALSRRLGEWPLLLTLANALLREEVRGGATVAEAVAFATRLYEGVGLQAFESGDEASRNSAARLSIGVSVGRLDAAKGEVARFEELAVFPEDEDIPAATITRLWHATSSLDPLAGDALLRALEKSALLLAFDRHNDTVRLHDVMRKFLRDLVGADGLIAQNQAIIDAYAGRTGADLEGPEQLYYYHYLPQHLHDARQLGKLDTLLMSANWMQQKLAATGPRALIDDYLFARTKAQKLTGLTLELIAELLARDKRQLALQILGRMKADLTNEPSEIAAIDGLMHDVRVVVIPPALVPRWANFTAPGGPEICRLRGHGRPIVSVALSPGGHHVVSGSPDGTLWLWDVASGQSRLLGRDSGRVTALAFSPDGRHIVSGSYGFFYGTLRQWDVASGQLLRLKRRVGNVDAVAFLLDGRQIVFGSYTWLWDVKSVQTRSRLWDVASGQTRLLGGHSHRDGDRATPLALSPGRRHVVSGSPDGTLRLWQLPSRWQGPPGRGWNLVHLSRLLPRMGKVTKGQERRAASNGKEPLRPRAGGGHGLVPATPASADPRTACPTGSENAGPLCLLRHLGQLSTA